MIIIVAPSVMKLSTQLINLVQKIQYNSLHFDYVEFFSTKKSNIFLSRVLKSLGIVSCIIIIPMWPEAE